MDGPNQVNAAQENGEAYPLLPRAAVGAVVFHNEKVLLVRRGQPPAEGLWAIPGGRVKIGETLQQAAEREIYEETGVKIVAGDPVFAFDVIVRDAKDRIRFHYVIVDLAAEYVAGTPLAGDDASQARWVSAEGIQRLALNATTRRLLRERYGFGQV